MALLKTSRLGLKAKAMKRKETNGKHNGKPKRTSIVAKGRLAKYLVFAGRKGKTVGGLNKDMLAKNKRGKIVSKRASAMGKRMYKNIESWLECVMQARGALRMKGFVAINGASVQGKSLYFKSKQLYSSRAAADQPRVLERPTLQPATEVDARLSAENQPVVSTSEFV